jgi:hypothetical protein
MSETKAPTAETGQEAETGAAKKNIPTPQAEPVADPNKKHTAEKDAEGYNGEDTGNKRQRFFSQTEVNRIVKREIERALKNSKLPELETAQAKVAELETQIKHKALREQVTEAAAKAGARNPGLLFRAVEEKLELDETGKPKNLDEIFKEARREYPELFGPATKGKADGGAGQHINTRLSMNELLRRSRS